MNGVEHKIVSYISEVFFYYEIPGVKLTQMKHSKRF